MRSYELTTVFPVEEEQFTLGIERVRSVLAEFNVTVESEADPIDRDLAYQIKKKQKGRYILFNIKANPDAVVGINRQFRLNQNLLTYLFVRVDE